MKKSKNGPEPGNEKITNQDEQDVAVNRSTAQQGGYDEPIHESSPPRVEKTGEKGDKSKPTPKKPERSGNK